MEHGEPRGMCNMVNLGRCTARAQHYGIGGATFILGHPTHACIIYHPRPQVHSLSTTLLAPELSDEYFDRLSSWVDYLFSFIRVDFNDDTVWSGRFLDLVVFGT